MYILAIDTSADDTSAAIVKGRRVLSHVEYSQIHLHTKFGGIYPSLAKRAHQDRIDWVIEKTLKNAKLILENIDAIAVTYGPGLAIALEVGLNKAKELAKNYNKPIIGIDHMEGHIYSNFVQNSKGNPKRDFKFPCLTLLVSGGHTELVFMKDHLTYEILGSTRDDAAGEALDKAARLLGFGYPGGPVIERLAKQVENVDNYHFPRPMLYDDTFDFSFAGLKTSFLYFVKKMDEKEKLEKLNHLASAFQEATFETLVGKAERAMKETGIDRLLVGGGVSVNQRLRYLIRKMVKKQNGTVCFPPYKYLNFDNAAMIGIAAGIRAERKLFSDIDSLDRKPRLTLLQTNN